MRKKGISLVSMAIAITVAITLISTISISLTTSINNSKKMTFAKEIYNIQSLVDEYVNTQETLPDTLTVIEIVPSDITQFEAETLLDGKLTLEILDLQALGLNNTSYGNEDNGKTNNEKAKDVYAVSSKTGKVYYIAGVEIDGKKYYTLTDELKQMIEKNQNLAVVEESITFIPNRVGWSNEAVTVTVKVPSDFASHSISIDNANIKYTVTTDDNVTYYSVNTTNVSENYTIEISYVKNGIQSNATYTTKIDKTNPAIFKDSSAINDSERINGLKATDKESGIKCFKYAEGMINLNDAKEYMYAYGKNIINGSINFKKKQNYTLYAEDKAGNYTIIYVDVTGTIVVETIPLGAIITGYNKYLSVDSAETTGNENTAPNSKEQNPTPQVVYTNKNLTWEYIGISKDGKIKIAPKMSGVIDDKYKVQLSGIGGYLNGAKELNDICYKLYSTTLGSASSIDMEDVTELLGYTGKKGRYYGPSATVTTYEPYTIGEIELNLGLTLKHTKSPSGDIKQYKSDYYKIYNTDSGITNTANLDFVYYQNQYWVATSCSIVDFSTDYSNVCFRMRAVNSNVIESEALFYSDGGSCVRSSLIRPVVELNSDVMLVKDTGATNTWKIQ